MSQIKSLVQWIGGDSRAARETQEHFSNGSVYFPIPLARAAVEAATGHKDDSLDTLKTVGKTAENMVEGTPVIGHARATIHYIADDTKRGNEIMNTASWSAAVEAGGVVGILACGPACAGAAAAGATGGVIAGIAAGTA